MLAGPVSPAQPLLEKMQSLIHTLNELVSLEQETHRVLKLPADQFMDGVPPAMAALERAKEQLMSEVDRLGTELNWLRSRYTAADDVPHDLQLRIDERNLRIRQVLQALQRMHAESERILKLRLALLSQDMHQAEQSRQFLRAAMQTMVA